MKSAIGPAGACLSVTFNKPSNLLQVLYKRVRSPASDCACDVQDSDLQTVKDLLGSLGVYDFLFFGKQLGPPLWRELRAPMVRGFNENEVFYFRQQRLATTRPSQR